MPEPLKNIYNPNFFQTFTAFAKEIVPGFNTDQFLQHVFDKDWEDRELKQRVRHLSIVLHAQLPFAYTEQISLLLKIVDQLERDGMKGGLEYIFFPDFIEQYGVEHLKTSLKGMERITQFISCEFAIRPFLLRYPKEIMAQMLRWSRHSHPHVRRFASEGCRPRLPWAMAIPALKKDPAPILPILENLKADESLFVRKSVANNLNDIAKDHPDVVAQVVANWKGLSPETDWIIRHGCRTLLKKAHPSTYALFDLDTAATCKVENLELSHTQLAIGGRLGFSFQLLTGKKASRIRLEYAVYYQKANGKQSRKIFQLTEKRFSADETITFKKEQRFQDFTTRKHYTGTHKLAIVVNGKEMAAKDFLLVQ